MRRVFVLSVIVLSIYFALLPEMSGAFPGLSSSQSGPAKTAEGGQTASALTGTVVETMDSGNYTYVLLDKKDEKVWVAVPQMHVEKGQTVSFRPGPEMGKFESKTLKRTFDNIIFSAGPVGKQGEESETKPVADQEKKSPAGEEIKIEKAAGPNAFTIAEIFKNKGSLDKQNVVVRAKVIKVSEAILGKNWIHLRDGSGDPKEGNLKLVATSQDLPSVGDVVTASGTIHIDRDFGSGYKYNVIMEETKIAKP